MIFFCQVDTYLGVKDYLRGGRCVRLVGVKEQDYSRLQRDDVGDGVTSFVLDIDLGDFVRKVRSTLWGRRREQLLDELEGWEGFALGARPWFRVDAKLDPRGLSYYYAAFSAEAPKRFAILSVVEFQGPQLAPLLLKPKARSTRTLYASRAGRFKVAPMPSMPKGGSAYAFSAFRVGQGMCSAVYNSAHVVLFDAGAGTPVTRKRFLTAPSFKNDLKTLVRTRNVPYLLLSHYDYDHWRLLAWDEDLRKKVEKVIVPDVPGISLAFFDTKLLGKVQKWDTMRINLSTRDNISCRRSLPQRSDSNGECLVALVTLGGRMGLVPGDYVYERLASDGERWIAGLTSLQYAAVIVPHHGDKASALGVPTSCAPAKAFFSAGDHKGFGHPTKVSKDAHHMAGFIPLIDRHEKDILEVSLF